jgi:hypothetical protein
MENRENWKIFEACLKRLRKYAHMRIIREGS